MNSATKGDGESASSSGSRALDEVLKDDLNGSGSDSGTGSGTTGNGSGGGSQGGGTGGSTGGFPGSVGGSGVDVASNGSPGCSQGECQGGVGVLFGHFNISTILYPDPDSQGGDCNELRGEPETGCIRALRQEGDWGSDTKPSCDEEPGRIDSALIPKIEIRSDRPFSLQTHSNPSQNFLSLSVGCSESDTNWSVQSPTLVVPFSYSSDGNNMWTFRITALYPENGTWVEVATKTLYMECGWGDSTPVKCVETPFPSRVHPDKVLATGMITQLND